DLRVEGAKAVPAVLPIGSAAARGDEEGQRVVLIAGHGHVGGHVARVRRADLQVRRGVMRREGGARRGGGAGGGQREAGRPERGGGDQRERGSGRLPEDSWYSHGDRAIPSAERSGGRGATRRDKAVRTCF